MPQPAGSSPKGRRGGWYHGYGSHIRGACARKRAGSSCYPARASASDADGGDEFARARQGCRRRPRARATGAGCGGDGGFFVDAWAERLEAKQAGAKNQPHYNAALAQSNLSASVLPCNLFPNGHLPQHLTLP